MLDFLLTSLGSFRGLSTVVGAIEEACSIPGPKICACVSFQLECSNRVRLGRSNISGAPTRLLQVARGRSSSS